MPEVDWAKVAREPEASAAALIPDATAKKIVAVVDRYNTLEKQLYNAGEDVEGFKALFTGEIDPADLAARVEAANEAVESYARKVTGYVGLEWLVDIGMAIWAAIPDAWKATGTVNWPRTYGIYMPQTEYRERTADLKKETSETQDQWVARKAHVEELRESADAYYGNVARNYFIGMVDKVTQEKKAESALSERQWLRDNPSGGYRVGCGPADSIYGYSCLLLNQLTSPDSKYFDANLAGEFMRSLAAMRAQEHGGEARTRWLRLDELPVEAKFYGLPISQYPAWLPIEQPDILARIYGRLCGQEGLCDLIDYASIAFSPPALGVGSENFQAMGETQQRAYLANAITRLAAGNIANPSAFWRGLDEIIKTVALPAGIGFDSQLESSIQSAATRYAREIKRLRLEFARANPEAARELGFDIPGSGTLPRWVLWGTGILGVGAAVLATLGGSLIAWRIYKRKGA